MKQIFSSLAIGLCLLATGCGSDDNPAVPTNTLSLNMMNESNGKTVLSGTDVYINKANNFYTDECMISELGPATGFIPVLEMSNTSFEVAVTPGTYYQIMDRSAIRNIAGEDAYRSNCEFYNLYVDSYIVGTQGNPVGAKVSYMKTKPQYAMLPEWGETIGIRLITGFDGVEKGEYTFDAGCMVEDTWTIYPIGNSGLKDYLRVKVIDNKISFENSAWMPSGGAEVVVNVRFGNIYSEVHFIVTNSGQ